MITVFLIRIVCGWITAKAICKHQIKWKVFRTMYAVAPEKWALKPKKFSPYEESYFYNCRPRLMVAYWKEFPEYPDYEYGFYAENFCFSLLGTMVFYVWSLRKEHYLQEAKSRRVRLENNVELQKICLSFQQDINDYVEKNCLVRK